MATTLPDMCKLCPILTWLIRFQENVGGTTYFFTQEELQGAAQASSNGGVILPNFTMYPGILPHVAHMKLKSNMPSFFMPDEIKMEILNRHGQSLAQIDVEQHPGQSQY